MAPKGNLTPRTIMAPAAAFCMAWVLFAYTRSSINEAKWNAVGLMQRSLTSFDTVC
ncbi:hypothetical protein EV127DRAFT_431348 [Xylaria flabelliformis]|nr:hypothetical protein EV127DRAFT_431348 [Xylaria flabelliformis]